MTTKNENRRTILFVNLYTEMGGGEYAVYNIVKGLDRSKFRPIMAFNQRGPFVEKVEAIGVETVILPYPTVMLQRLIIPKVFLDVLRSSKSLREYVREEEIDCLHCVDVLSLLICARAIMRFRIPVVYNVIFFYEWTRMLLFNFLALFLVKRIVTNSKAIRNDLLARTMFLPHKTEVVYYGIDNERFRPAVNGEANILRKEFGIDRHEKLVGMIARYDVWKGHLTFLEAASSIRKERPDVKFVIIGGLLNAQIITPLQEYYDTVQARRSSLGLSQDVMMISHRDDIPELLRGLDIFVCPSKKEPIPLIVFEAMASGIPVVAADSGGIPEQISHEKDGLLFRTDDAYSLSQAVLCILDAKDGNRVMVQAARAKIEQQFTVGRFVKDMEKVYENAMKKAA